MLVDHMINFKGCKHVQVIGKEINGMKEFVNDHFELLQKIPEFANPDFTQINRLPAKARLLDIADVDVLDEWTQFSQDPLWHMTMNECKKCHQTIGHVFTGGDESDDEEGERLDRYLHIGKDDIMFVNSQLKKDKAHGEVTLDIDSILALFTDLSVINTVIAISIIVNPMMNLKRSIHLIHNGIPLH